MLCTGGHNFAPCVELEKGTVSPLHYDRYSNLLCQVVGRKRLTCFAPCDSAPKRFYSRGLEPDGFPDTREWSVTASSGASKHYTVKNLATGRCLAASASPGPDSAGLGAPPASLHGVALLPCDASDSNQAWGFGKGPHSPSSLYHIPTGMALAVDPSTLFGATVGKDQWPTPSKACESAATQPVAASR
mgnify:CR=1 FL=1